MSDDRDGFWIAWYADWSGFSIWPTEIEALRAAVAGGGGMSVEFRTWGDVR
jgi:hypothetical protein